jgi:Saccharopine dehydrogenase NADP binding domain
VVAELARRGWPAILVGRDATKLEAVALQSAPTAEVHVASIDAPDALDRAFAGAAAVINCAGPFLDTAAPVLDAAVRARIHYLDVTAEQPAARATFDDYGRAAAEANIVVAPAVAFYGGLADLLATAAMGSWVDGDEILVAVALDSWRPTQGTRLTGDRNTAPRVVYVDGELRPLDSGASARRWEFPPPFGTQEVVALPLSEVITISRHLRVSQVGSYMNQQPLDDLDDPDTPSPAPSDESGRSDQIFCMDVVVRRAGEERRATAQGRDIYAVSAPLVVEAAVRILTGRVRRTGAGSAGELFEAREFLEALDPTSLSVELS